MATPGSPSRSATPWPLPMRWNACIADPALAGELAERASALVRAEFDMARNVDRLLEQFQAVAASSAP